MNSSGSEENDRRRLEKKLERLSPEQRELLKRRLSLRDGKSAESGKNAVAAGSGPARETPAAPGTVLEEHLKAVFSEILGRDDFGIEDSFFQLGGHSLLVTRLSARCSRDFGILVSPSDIFQNPSIRSLSLWLGSKGVDKQVGHASGMLAPNHSAEISLEEKHLPLSQAQRGLWFIDRTGLGSREYNVTRAYRFRGNLNVEALKKALQTLVQRHDVFRTRFVDRMGEPLQAVSPRGEVVLQQDDLSGLEGPQQSQALKDQLNEIISTEYNLGASPLARFVLFRLGEREHVFLLSCHHIISDGWSISVFNRELGALYNAYCEGLENPLKPLRATYGDFCREQEAYLQGKRFQHSAEFWVRHLRNVPVLNLPLDHPRSGQSDPAGEQIEFRLPPELTRKLRDFNRETGSTSYMTAMAAFQVMLFHYTGDTDIAVGTPFANRLSIEHENIFGFFVNTLVHRTKVSPEATFHELLTRVKATTLEMFDHQEMPFNKVVELLNPKRRPGCHPIFQVAMALQNSPRVLPALASIETLKIDLPYSTTHFDFLLHLRTEEDYWKCSLVYRKSLFKPVTMRAMAENFRNLLENLMDNANVPLSEIPLGQIGRKTPQPSHSNSSAAVTNRCVHEVFEAVAAEHPEYIALEEGESNLSYAELNTRANRLAARLRQAGVSKGDHVGVLMGRSSDFIVSILAILKQGGCYVPIPMDIPESRIHYIICDAGIRVVLVRGPQPVPDLDATVTLVDLRKEQETALPDLGNPSCKIRPEDPAYVIYTSGTTGQPKGVVIPHKGIVRLVRGQSYADFSPSECFLFLASPAFDASTFEIWGPLLNGGKCAVYSSTLLDLDDLEKAVRRHGVTTLWLTSGLFNLVVDSQPGILGTVQHVLTGGEALSPGHVRKARSMFPGMRLTNGYGPTESTTFATTYEIRENPDPGGSVPIGKPIAHTVVYIVDAKGKPLPPGLKGELWIGGEGLAKGYLNDENLTAEKFVPDPFSETPGSRLYRTGDLCRFLPDGRIEFIGRMDKQVKIRGYRLELGEIEEAASRFPGTRQAVADTFRETGGTLGIVLYVTTMEGKGNRAFTDALRQHLVSELPDYAVPSRFVLIGEIPLTVNGKVDYQKLSEASPHPDDGLSPSPADDNLENSLLDIWKTLFGRDDLTATDRFFEIGGHSLMVPRLQAEIEKSLGVKLPVSAIFSTPTVRGLSRVIGSGKGKPLSMGQKAMVVLQPKGALDPLFCIHGWGGDVFGFIDLANSLAPERPVYGLQALGYDGSGPRQKTVEEMADLYYREIRALRPEGPYNLIGYSAGGWMAYAVAQNFARARAPVNLFLLDTGMSCRVPYHLYLQAKVVRMLGRIPYHLSRWARLPMRDKAAYFRERLAWLKSDVKRTGRIPEYPPPGIGPNNQPARSDYFAYVASQYRPDKYHGNLDLFTPVDARKHRWAFWKYLIKGNLELHRVEIDHGGFITREGVARFIELFKAVLARRDASRSPEDT